MSTKNSYQSIDSSTKMDIQESFFDRYPTNIRFLIHLNILIKTFTIAVSIIPLIYLFHEKMYKDEKNIVYFAFSFLRTVWTILSFSFFMYLLKPMLKDKDALTIVTTGHGHSESKIHRFLTKMHTRSVLGYTVSTLNCVMWTLTVVIGFVLYANIYSETKDNDNYEGFKTAHLVQCIYVSVYYFVSSGFQIMIDYCE